MKIKDYKCKCGCNDFFFVDKGNQKGIYCTKCGKWIKWATKEEARLIRHEKTENAFTIANQDFASRMYALAVTCAEAGTDSCDVTVNTTEGGKLYCHIEFSTKREVTE